MDKAGVVKRFRPELIWDAEVQHYLEQAFGVDQFRLMSEATIRPPLNTCIRANTLKASLEAVVEGLKKELNTEGLLEKAQIRLHSQVPDAILISGQAPLKVDYNLPAGKEVVISRKAGEAVLRGSHLYVPGVLACSAGVAKGDLVAVSIALEGKDGRNVIVRGTTLDQCSEPVQHADLYIGVGRAHLSRREMFRADSGIAVSMEQPVFRTLACNGILYGKIMPQNLPSLVAAHVLNPNPGSRVCDMCAAPGGKATALAQIMGDKGQIIALDRSQSKVQHIRNLAAELGITCISAHKMDSTKACAAAKEGDLANKKVRLIDEVAAAESELQDCPATAVLANGLRARDDEVAAVSLVFVAADGKHGSVKPGQNGVSRIAEAKATKEVPVLQQLTKGDAISKSEAECSPDGNSNDPLRSSCLSCEKGRTPGGGSPAQEKSCCWKSACNRRQQGAVKCLAEEQQTRGYRAVKQELSLKGQAKVDARLQRKQAAAFRSGGTVLSAPRPEAKLEPFPPESFDHVLLDAPCTALGLRPRLQQRADMAYLQTSAGYQRRMLRNAVALLKPGGTLVYSTCTINPGENEANVRFVLDKYPEMQLVPQTPTLGAAGLVGKSAAGDEHWLTAEQSKLVQRFSPHGPLDTIGFFIAKFQKC